MGIGKDFGISRREFARRAALVSAASAFAPTDLLDARITQPIALPHQPPTLPQQQPVASDFSPASQAEIESRVQAILAQYGFRLSAAQKDDIRRLATEAQSTIDRLRSYPTENGDGPALYLYPLNERPRKSAGTPAASRSTNGRKKP